MVLEASTDYVATTDLTGRVLFANAAFRNRFGVEEPEQIDSDSHGLFGFVSPQSRARFVGDGVPALWRTGRWSGEIEGLVQTGRPFRCDRRRSLISAQPASPSTSQASLAISPR